MCSDPCKQVFGATFGKEWIQCLYPCDQLSRFQNVTKLLKKKEKKILNISVRVKRFLGTFVQNISACSEQ